MRFVVRTVTYSDMNGINTPRQVIEGEVERETEHCIFIRTTEGKLEEVPRKLLA